MRQLLDEFTDRRVCAICGAPAARLIVTDADVWNGEVLFKTIDVPVQVRCSQYAPGAERVIVEDTDEQASRGIGRRERRDPKVVFVRTLTHECRRDHALKGRPGYRSCGLLNREQTGVAVGEMPDECYLVTPSDGTSVKEAYLGLMRKMLGKVGRGWQA
jgi:hypothetical protein